MAGRIAVIRHGQTQWSASGRHTSVTDIGLTAEGERQAGVVPALLAGLGLRPVTVLCSPRLRARITAELAGLHVDAIDEELAEWAYGDYEGLTTEEITRRQPGWAIFDDGAPGGETPPQVADRADRVLGRARAALEHGDVALIGHGHFSRAVAVRWAGFPITAGNAIAMDPAAVTVLGHHHGQQVLQHTNVVPMEMGPSDGAPAADVGSADHA